MLLKCSTQYASKFQKLSSDHRTGKGQFSFQFQRKAMPRMFRLPYNCAHFITDMVMLKILQAMFQQYVNWELPGIHARFRKGRGTRDQITNIHWITEKARKFQEKKMYFCFIDYDKGFDYVDHNKLWKILKDMGTPDHLPPEKPVCRTRSNI